MSKKFTVGFKTTKENAEKTASEWRNPSMGYHTQVIEKDGKFICEVLING